MARDNAPASDCCNDPAVDVAAAEDTIDAGQHIAAGPDALSWGYSSITSDRPAAAAPEADFPLSAISSRGMSASNLHDMHGIILELITL